MNTTYPESAKVLSLINRHLIKYFLVFVLFMHSFVTAQPGESSDSASVENQILIEEEGYYSEKQETEVDKEVSDRGDLKEFRHFGLGLGAGLHIFNPNDINSYLDDIYENMKSGYTVLSEYGSSSMLVGFLINAHIRIDPIPYITIVPNATLFSAPKVLKINTSSISVTLSNYSFGSQIAGIINPRKSMSIKLGVNIAYALTTLTAEEENEIVFKGSGLEVSPTLGLIFNPGKGKVSINLDFMVPLYTAELEIESDETDPLEDDDTYSAQKPQEAQLSGFIIRPGVTFKF